MPLSFAGVGRASASSGWQRYRSARRMVRRARHPHGCDGCALRARAAGRVDRRRHRTAVRHPSPTVRSSLPTPAAASSPGWRGASCGTPRSSLPTAGTPRRCSRRDWAFRRRGSRSSRRASTSNASAPAPRDDAERAKLGWENRLVGVDRRSPAAPQGARSDDRGGGGAARAVSHPALCHRRRRDRTRRPGSRGAARRSVIVRPLPRRAPTTPSSYAPYQQCDLFALPNRTAGMDFEGFGMVLLEAQACGRAVLAGDSGGTAAALRAGETGVLVDCRRADTLAAAVAALLSDPAAARAPGRCRAAVDRARVLIRDADAADGDDAATDPGAMNPIVVAVPHSHRSRVCGRVALAAGRIAHLSVFRFHAAERLPLRAASVPSDADFGAGHARFHSLAQPAYALRSLVVARTGGRVRGSGGAGDVDQCRSTAFRRGPAGSREDARPGVDDRRAGQRRAPHTRGVLGDRLVVGGAGDLRRDARPGAWHTARSLSFREYGRRAARRRWCRRLRGQQRSGAGARVVGAAVVGAGGTGRARMEPCDRRRRGYGESARDRVHVLARRILALLVAVGVIALSYSLWWQRAAVFLGFVVVLVVLAPQPYLDRIATIAQPMADVSFRERTEIWRQGTEIGLAHALLEEGPGMFQQPDPRTATTRRAPHNIFVELIAEVRHRRSRRLHLDTDCRAAEPASCAPRRCRCELGARCQFRPRGSTVGVSDRQHGAESRPRLAAVRADRLERSRWRAPRRRRAAFQAEAFNTCCQTA